MDSWDKRSAKQSLEAKFDAAEKGEPMQEAEEEDMEEEQPEVSPEGKPPASKQRKPNTPSPSPSKPSFCVQMSSDG